jgi:hypothetical protein
VVGPDLPYVKNTQVYNCPSNPYDGSDSQDTRAYVFPPTDRNPGQDEFGSYLYNFYNRFGGSDCQGVAPFGGDNPHQGQLSIMPEPAATVLLTESTGATARAFCTGTTGRPIR